MALPQGLSSAGATPGDTEEGRARATNIAARSTGLRGGSGIFTGQNVRKLGAPTGVVEGGRGTIDMRALRKEKARGLRTGPTTNVSDSAKKLLSNGDFAKDFARQAKEINTNRGLTKSQRKAQVKNVQTRLAVEGGNLTGDAAEQALDLSRTSTERGLTSSQRTGLTDASTKLLKGAAAENSVDPGSDFELDLLKFFDL